MIKRLIILAFLLSAILCPAVYAQSSEKMEDKANADKKEFAVFTSVYSNNQGLGTLYRFRKDAAVSFQFFFNTDQQNRAVLNQGPCDLTLCNFERRTYGLKSILAFEFIQKNNLFSSFQFGYYPGYRQKYTEYFKLPYYDRLGGFPNDGNYYEYNVNRHSSPLIGIGVGKKIFSPDGFYFSYEIGGRYFLNSSTSVYARPTDFNVYLNGPPPSPIAVYLAERKIRPKSSHYEIYFGFQIGIF